MPWVAQSLGLLPGGSFSRPYDMDNAGINIVGQADDSGTVNNAVYWNQFAGYAITALPTINGTDDGAFSCGDTGYGFGNSAPDTCYWNVASGIPAATSGLPAGFLSGSFSSAGTGVQGAGGNGVDGASVAQGIVYGFAGALVALDALPGGTSSYLSLVTNIAVSPQVGFGYSDGSGFTKHAFAYNFINTSGPGAFTLLDLGALTADISQVNAYFDDGNPFGGTMFAVGVSPDGGGHDRAVIWNGTYTQFPGPGFALVSGPTDLGTLPGGDTSSATLVSADGTTIAGQSNDGTGMTQAVTVISGTMAGLGILPGGTFSEAHAISGDGTRVVGRGDDGTSEWALLFEIGSITKLPPLPGVVAPFVYSADLVNSIGAVIVGRGTDSDGHHVGVIWTFVPASRNPVQGNIIGRRTGV